MASMLEDGPFHGVRFEGRRFDCGNKIGFVEATLALALSRPEMAPAVREIIANLR
jgi:UTP--glucose-1-phosphate uridylyltransferase